jgi:hypothetical protein
MEINVCLHTWLYSVTLYYGTSVQTTCIRHQIHKQQISSDFISYLQVCCILFYVYIYTQGVSGGTVNILGGGSMDYSE